MLLFLISKYHGIIQPHIELLVMIFISINIVEMLFSCIRCLCVQVSPGYSTLSYQCIGHSLPRKGFYYSYSLLQMLNNYISAANIKTYF